jgi:hypothetical protein
MYEAALLPEAERRDMCIGLLEEFGVSGINETRKGELQHSCILPFNLHSRGDSSPSASLNYKKLVYKCLGCGAGGSLLWFIATMQGTDTKAARTWLTKSAGIGQVMDVADLMRYFDMLYRPKDRPEPPPSYSANILRPGVRFIPISPSHVRYQKRLFVTSGPDTRSITRSFRLMRKKGRPAEFAECIIIPHFLG